MKSRFLIPALILCLVTSWIAVSAAASPDSLRNSLVLPFNYKNVSLDGGRMRTQYEEVRADYLRIPEDDLLKGYRTRAGLPAPGNDMGGEYDSGIFNIFGQIISGLSRFGAADGSEAAACREKAARLVHEWGKCIAPDGFFFNTPKGATMHYVYEKMVGGLVDNYVYCGNEEALEHLSRITNWAMAILPRNHHGWNSEWYTLSENLYRAYLATGEERYREYAEVWEYPEYWNLYAGDRDIFSDYPKWLGNNKSYHAYSHVNTLSGAAAAYWVKADGNYLSVIKNAYKNLVTSQTLATGGYGPGERLMTRSQLIDSLADPFEKKHFETQCGSWAAFKLSKYLIRFTGDGQYGDWIENLVYNGIGASLSAPEGKVMYCSDYHLGGATKVNTLDPWTCCAGTRSMAIADYLDLVYFHSKDELYVNLFTPSTVRWFHDGTTVTLTQKTSFPESDTVDFKVSVSKPVRFGLRVRNPRWAMDYSATLNNAEECIIYYRNNWLGFEHREWQDGDTLKITLPMGLKAICAHRQEPLPLAVSYGPIVLAVGSTGTNPGNKINAKFPGRSLLPVEGKPLHFQFADDPSLVARPFYEFQEGERYFLYFDPAWANRISMHDAVFKGKWLWGTTNEVGASMEYPFYGTGIRWIGRRFDDCGKTKVAIDGKVITVVDQYGQVRDEPFSWEHMGLAPGKHVLRITVLPEKNPASRGNHINIRSFEIPEPNDTTTVSSGI